VDLRAGDADVAIWNGAKCLPTLSPREIFRDTFFPICTLALVEKYARPIQRAAGVLRYPLIHFDWTNRDPEAPTWVRRITTARSVDPDVPGIDRAWELSFRAELHAIVVAVQGMAICSDIVVSRELRSGALVKAQWSISAGIWILPRQHASSFSGTDDRGLLNLDESNDLTVWAALAFFANPRVIGEHVMVRHCRTISSTKAPFNGVRRENAGTTAPDTITL